MTDCWFSDHLKQSGGKNRNIHAHEFSTPAYMHSKKFRPSGSCDYCGRSGHSMPSCYMKKHDDMMAQKLWKTSHQNATNPAGPKETWVPKCAK